MQSRFGNISALIDPEADACPAMTRAERRDQQTQRVLEAAKTCFVRSGFQGASMQEICAQADMSPGALYRYFPSKEAIIEAICAADRREDARVSYDTQIKTLTKEAKERTKLSRAAQSLQEKVELQKEGAALKRQADDLQHQLYTRLREIDVERERMLDDIAEKLSLTPESTTLFTIRWSLA